MSKKGEGLRYPVRSGGIVSDVPNFIVGSDVMSGQAPDYYIPGSTAEDIERMAKADAMSTVDAMKKVSSIDADVALEDSRNSLFGLSHRNRQPLAQQNISETEAGAPFGETERRKFAQQNAGSLGVRQTISLEGAFVYWER